MLRSNFILRISFLYLFLSVPAGLMMHAQRAHAPIGPGANLSGRLDDGGHAKTLSVSSSPGQGAGTDVRVTDDKLSADLIDGRTITVPLAWYPKLLHATAAQRSNWRIAGGGYGIHWPDIGEDLSSEGLLRGAPAPRRAPCPPLRPPA